MNTVWYSSYSFIILSIVSFITIWIMLFSLDSL
jgi:hypothetical protein